MCQELRIPGAVADSLSAETDGGRLRVLREKVETFNTKYKQVAQGSQSPNRGSQAAAGVGAGTGQAGSVGPAHQPRTLSQPQFSEGDRPIDVGKVIEPSTALDLSEFEASKEFLGPTRFPKRFSPN